ncbi:hypothetical protein HID58_092732 [Brassica napus]|uniref:Ankyrin repeat family protein n=1 Tax=Brassica napus TaxID=3708 RepID=A0ABQ7XDF4_BRANA|nr:hypothetical protein HID58_092732 [Brassica napus]
MDVDDFYSQCDPVSHGSLNRNERQEAMEAETDAMKGQESKQQIRDEELFKAAESGDFSVFMSLSLQQLAKSISFRNEDGRSLLHVSASSVILSDLSFTKEKKSDIKSVWLWDLQIVKLLSSVHESKTAPLHSTASIGKAELVEILLTRGADVNVKNNGGRTALHYAASKGWLEIAQLYFKSDERVPTELKKAIMQARGVKNLTHSQLAQNP